MISKVIFGKQNKASNHQKTIDACNTFDSFDTEALLVKSFESLANKHSTNILKEFDCSNGIADIIFFDLRKNWQNTSELGDIPSRWAYALLKLPYRRNFTIDEYLIISGMSIKYARRALEQFEKVGFCKKGIKKDTWVKVRQPRPIVNKIYAIEAKLKNWKRALIQADRYRYYATQSWVLLDAFSIKPAVKNIEQFKRLNVGLASITSSGEISNYYTPTSKPPKSKLHYWQANSEIAQRVKSSF